METILATEQPAEAVVRHLAAGSAEHTLCGLDRAELNTVHPSKARKTDCAACREAWRMLKIRKPKHEPFIDSEIPVPAMTPKAIEIISADGELKSNLISFKEYSVGTTKPGPGEPNPPDDVTPEEQVPDAVTETQDAQEAESDADDADAEAEAKALTPDEIDAEVLRLRALGMSHIKIETAMGWSQQHGNRSWRICHRLKQGI
jgi:hypothetical protein